MFAWDIAGVNTHTSGPNTVSDAPGHGDDGAADAADALLPTGIRANAPAVTATARNQVSLPRLRVAVLQMCMERSFASVYLRVISGQWS